MDTNEIRTCAPTISIYRNRITIFSACQIDLNCIQKESPAICVVPLHSKMTYTYEPLLTAHVTSAYIAVDIKPVYDIPEAGRLWFLKVDSIPTNTLIMSQNSAED